MKYIIFVLIVVSVFSCEFVEPVEVNTNHFVDSSNNFVFTVTNEMNYATIDHIDCKTIIYYDIDKKMEINFSFDDLEVGEENIFTYNLGSAVYIYSHTIMTVHVH